MRFQTSPQLCLLKYFDRRCIALKFVTHEGGPQKGSSLQATTEALTTTGAIDNSFTISMSRWRPPRSILFNKPNTGLSHTTQATIIKPPQRFDRYLEQRAKPRLNNLPTKLCTILHTLMGIKRVKGPLLEPPQPSQELSTTEAGCCIPYITHGSDKQKLDEKVGTVIRVRRVGFKYYRFCQTDVRHASQAS